MSGHTEHLKELQVVCQTKVKVKENGESEVHRVEGGNGNRQSKGESKGGGETSAGHSSGCASRGGHHRGIGSSYHVPVECQHLMRDSEVVKAPELTWHEIGKSMDNILFWIFFIITNTVTTIVLVMFVGL